MRRERRGKVIPHGEEIADANVGQNYQSPTADTLNSSASEQHLNTGAQSSYQRARQEDHVGDKQYGFATPDITEFTPGRG